MDTLLISSVWKGYRWVECFLAQNVTRQKRQNVSLALFISCVKLYRKHLTMKSGARCVVVSALDFTSEGRWFDAQSLPWCCFLRQQQESQEKSRQETLPHIRLSVPRGINGYRRHTAGATLRWTSIPSRGSSNTLSCFMLQRPG